MRNEPSPQELTPKKFRPRKAAAARIFERWGYKISGQTLAKLACNGGGPPYRKIGSQTVYADDECDAWVQRRLSPLMRSTSDVTSDGATDDRVAAIPAERPSASPGPP